MLELKGIEKKFNGLKVLDNISFKFEAGKIYAIVGPNGAGKTTLLNIISGFLKPDKGEIFFKGKNITDLPPYKRARMGIGRLFQEVRNFKRINLEDNVLTAREWGKDELKSLEVKKNTENISKLFYDFNLKEPLQKYAEALSFGQEKVLSLIRLFYMNPDLYLLDEPITGLSKEMQNIVFKKLKFLAKAQKKLIILVEHEILFVKEIADVVIFMDKGKIVKVDLPQRIFEDTEFINKYVGVISPDNKKVAKIQITEENSSILRVQNVNFSYGKREVLKNVNMEIKNGETVAILGHNGAGKSTLLKIMAGILKPQNGKIFLNGEDITSWTTERFYKKGIIYFIQGGEIFADMSVDENLELAGLDIPKQKLIERKKEIYSLFPELRSKKKLRAGLLSGGERQMLALGMVLIGTPMVLLLDEPSAGLSVIYQKKLVYNINMIKQKFKISIVLVEQNLNIAAQLADRFYIMKEGKIVREKFKIVGGESYV